jgi:hypothetical protein
LRPEVAGWVGANAEFYGYEAASSLLNPFFESRGERSNLVSGYLIPLGQPIVNILATHLHDTRDYLTIPLRLALALSFLFPVAIDLASSGHRVRQELPEDISLISSDITRK